MRLFRLPEMQATTELVIGCILIMIVVLGFVLHGLWEKHRKRSTGAAGDAKSALLPYKTRPLLTDEEQRFYALLRPEAERAGLDLLAKVRIADFISVAPRTGAGPVETILCEDSIEACGFPVDRQTNARPASAH